MLIISKLLVKLFNYIRMEFKTEKFIDIGSISIYGFLLNSYSVDKVV